MHIGLRLVAISISCAALTSCVPPGGSAARPTLSPVGTYDFTIRDGSVLIVGTIEVRDDTLMVKPRDGSCFIDRTDQRQDEWVMFKCNVAVGVNDLTIGVSHRNPEARARWSGSTLRTVEQRECTAYITDARGQRVCSETRTLRVEQMVSIGGSLIVRYRAPGT